MGVLFLPKSYKAFACVLSGFYFGKVIYRFRLENRSQRILRAHRAIDSY